MIIYYVAGPQLSNGRIGTVYRTMCELSSNSGGRSCRGQYKGVKKIRNGLYPIHLHPECSLEVAHLVVFKDHKHNCEQGAMSVPGG